MQEVVSSQGRDAKNLFVYQFCDDIEASNNFNHEKPEHRKPPKSPNSLNAAHTPKKARSPSRLSAAKNAGTPGPRVRSASTDRDKRSELQARYWALLFGNLQRAVNEIYQTVESYENISSCQEAILVLENYVRDFKALGEWFKVSWDYESRPVQQRPQSLAWEVRKSNPAPRIRTKSLSSPSPTSGKSSPCLCHLNSGKSSPCCVNYENMSPRKCLRIGGDASAKCPMHVCVRDLFASNKAQQQLKELRQQQIVNSNINNDQQSGHQSAVLNNNTSSIIKSHKPINDEVILNGSHQIETETISSPNLKHQYAQTDLEDDHLTLADIREKLHQEEQARKAAAIAYIPDGAEEIENVPAVVSPCVVDEKDVPSEEIKTLPAKPSPSVETLKSENMETMETTNLVFEPTALDLTVQKLNAMEEIVLNDYANKPAITESTVLKPPIEAVPQPIAALHGTNDEDKPANAGIKEAAPPSETPIQLVENVTAPSTPSVQPSTAATVDVSKKTAPPTATTATPQQNGPLKYSSVLNRPAARTNVTTAANSNSPQLRMTSSARSSIVSGTKLAVNSLKRTAQSAPAIKQTTQRGTFSTTNRFNNSGQSAYNTQNIPPRPSSKSETYAYGPPTHVASRLSHRSRTMVDMNGTKADTPNVMLTKRSIDTKRQLNSSSATNSRKSSREDIGSSTSTLKASNERITMQTRSNNQTDERHSEPKQLPSEANDGWLTVKNRRRSSMHWSNRFNQPTGYASLPTLTLLVEQKKDANELGESCKTRIRAVRKPEKPASNKTKETKAHAKEKATVSIKAPATSGTSNLASKQQRKEPTTSAAPVTNGSQQKSAKLASRPEIKNAKAKVNSLPPQRKIANQSLPAASKSKSTPITNRNTFIKRQKSDITGLKMTSLHEEYIRSEQSSFALKNQAMSALALATENSESRDSSMGASSTETIVEARFEADATGDQAAAGDSGEQNKIDIKIQTNRDFSKTIGDLYESIATMSKSRFFMNGDMLADKNGVKRGNRLPMCEEDEDELDATLTNEMLDCDEHQRLLVEEQEALERQIRELESTEIDVDTETDETDCEVALDQDENDDEMEMRKLQDMHAQHVQDPAGIVFVSINDEESKCCNAAAGSCHDHNHVDDDDFNSQMSLETRYQDLFSEMSFGERVEALATLEAYVARHPGRAQELHQKLSSPSRRRSLHETLKKYQAKQARAQEKREFLQKEKAVKIQQLLTRVEDVKSARLQIIEVKRQKMEDRLQRAAENREQHLRQIIEKAHDEEKKLKEINFIKNIEAQNKRLDLIESSKDAEGRLQDLEQERQKRLEEKAAKEAAVERRRQQLEQDRQRKLEKMNESRLEREIRIERMQEEKERQRQALAAEKARDREERLLALQVQQQQTTEELQRKIFQKQQESARRHEENMEHIRQRALELSIPSRNQEGELNGELGAENGADGEHSSSVSESSVREHSRNFKKKLKKLKQRMTQCAEEYLSQEQQALPAHMKRDSQVPKYLNLITKGGGSQGLERSLLQLMRLISKAEVIDFQCFLLMDGLGIIMQHVILKSIQDSEISKKALVLAIQLYRNACSVCPQISRHAVLGNSLAGLLDLLFYNLQLPEEKSPQHPVELSTELMLACTVALSPSYGKKHAHPKTLERLPDLISYAVIIGLVEALARRCQKIRESVESQKSVILSLLATLGLLTKFIDVCQPGPTDSTRLLSAAKSTEMFGAISMLYASVVPVGECIPPRTVSLAAATFNLLVSIAVLDLSTYQETLKTEALALKYLDVITILLKYCGTKEKILKNPEMQAMMIDLIASIGFYCANNRKHQDLLTSEQCAIIIKSLTKLPEQFQTVVYPCIVTITYKNQNARNVIARDFNLDFLDEYHKSEMGKKNHLVTLLKT